MGFYTTRSMRDGSVKIEDGSSPVNTCTVICDEGDVSWTINKEYLLSYCRGELGGKRKGSTQQVTLSFTSKAATIVGNNLDSSDPITPYDILHNSLGNFKSTADDHYAVKVTFTTVDPEGVAPNEVIVFSKFAPETITFQEAEETNTLAFDGASFEEAPTITHVAV